DNSIAALATGNTTSPSNSILDETHSASEWGHRILSSQIASHYIDEQDVYEAVVTEETLGNNIGAGLVGFLVDSLTVTGNQISATSIDNRVENGIVGVPSSDTSLRGASISGTGSSSYIDFEIMDAHSSIASVQVAIGVEASAVVSNSDLEPLQTTGIGFANVPGGSTGAAFTVTRNSISASL